MALKDVIEVKKSILYYVLSQWVRAMCLAYHRMSLVFLRNHIIKIALMKPDMD